jgi:lambda repressor-like predicted transcriptional regulator
MTTQLTPAQHAILAYAIEHTDGKIDWFPDNIKGGARKKVLDGLFNRALITPLGDDWFVAAEGYDALGLPRPAPITVAKLDAIIANAEAKAPRTRADSKQAQVIAMLKRPEGATIAQICEATGWQNHTVRGTFSGAFKKKLGLTIVSDKPQGGERVYRIA